MISKGNPLILNRNPLIPIGNPLIFEGSKAPVADMSAMGALLITGTFLLVRHATNDLTNHSHAVHILIHMPRFYLFLACELFN